MSSILVIGGCRSGKSRYAQESAEAVQSDDKVYLATSLVLDEEMEARVARHQADRGGQWRTEEVPYELPERLAALDVPSRVCLVDCLTMWISNLLCSHQSADCLEQRFFDLVQVVSSCRSTIFLVSNEVGTGIVPESALSRRFRDSAGQLNQRLAEASSHVCWMVAGIPVAVKSAGRVRLRPEFGA